MDAFSCAADGEYSLLAACPAFAVGMGDGVEPVMVHITVCRQHLRGARARLRLSTFSDGDIDTYPTAVLMEHWAEFEAGLGVVPVMRMAAAV